MPLRQRRPSGIARCSAADCRDASFMAAHSALRLARAASSVCELYSRVRQRPLQHCSHVRERDSARPPAADFARHLQHPLGSLLRIAPSSFSLLHCSSMCSGIAQSLLKHQHQHMPEHWSSICLAPDDRLPRVFGVQPSGCLGVGRDRRRRLPGSAAGGAAPSPC